ncbi:myeloperoxidase-like isoform X1 [Mytilus californianus]|uniref:myeloperoxidase-like isoform X1 n=1 Tax=Mytilus californianus TaxID=6549 RepID=UPI0022486C34|nr:myeloperoxidase-like isoform X1 [Mytilus californianus]
MVISLTTLLVVFICTVVFECYQWDTFAKQNKPNIQALDFAELMQINRDLYRPENEQNNLEDTNDLLARQSDERPVVETRFTSPSENPTVYLNSFYSKKRQMTGEITDDLQKRQPAKHLDANSRAYSASGKYRQRKEKPYRQNDFYSFPPIESNIWDNKNRQKRRKRSAFNINELVANLKKLKQQSSQKRPSTSNQSDAQKERDGKTISLFGANMPVPGDSFRHGLRFDMPNSNSLSSDRCSNTSSFFPKTFGGKTAGMLSEILKDWYRKHCKTETNQICDENNRYASADGSCNNLDHPSWGVANRNQGRYIPAEYNDGLNEPRIYGKYDTKLPEPRVISNMLFRPQKSTKLSQDLTILHMAWGQFMIHDVIKTPITKGVKGSDIQCCGANTGNSPDCFSLAIPPNDPHFNKESRCLNFVRSLPGKPDNDMPGIREQINEITSFLDGSAIYGSSEEQMKDLKMGYKGLLATRECTFSKKVSNFMGKPTIETEGCRSLPKGPDTPCLKLSKGDYYEYCQKAGDRRVNVIPNLCALHNLLVRYHNKIAERLAQVNFILWSSDQLFEETRKIVTAILQHTTYNEYLPLVIGNRNMIRYELFSAETGFDTVYNKMVDATVKNSFEAAAFRFGHSQITNFQSRMNSQYNRYSETPIEQTYKKPRMCTAQRGKNIPDLLRWMFTDRSAEADRYFESGVRDKLFSNQQGKSLDLPAMNIQRGRDHGLPGYNAFRRWCNLAVGYSFGRRNIWSLSDHSYSNTRLLRKIYRHPDDIDLYVGGISENHVPDGAVGPTFACIIGQQFRDIKFGDRFWYENNFTITGFTLDQVNEIKKVKLSQIICEGSDVNSVQENALKAPSFENPRRECSGFPDIDLNKWKVPVSGDTFTLFGKTYQKNGGTYVNLGDMKNFLIPKNILGLDNE